MLSLFPAFPISIMAPQSTSYSNQKPGSHSGHLFFPLHPHSQFINDFCPFCIHNTCWFFPLLSICITSPKGKSTTIIVRWTMYQVSYWSSSLLLSSLNPFATQRPESSCHSSKTPQWLPMSLTIKSNPLNITVV